MEKYVSSKMEFNFLKTRESVAKTCWGYQANGNSPVFNYDVKGTGYVSFTLKKTGSCDSPDAINILYYSSNGASPTDGSKYEKEIEDALKSGGGNAGQNYDGLFSDFPINPDPHWS